MPAGRPTKYNDSIIDAIDEYLLTTGQEFKTLPTREGFAEYIKVNTDTLVEWDKKFPKFSVAIKRLDEKQKQELVNLGLFNGANATMAIFLLKANHSMIETSRQEVTGKDGEKMQIILDMPK